MLQPELAALNKKKSISRGASIKAQICPRRTPRGWGYTLAMLASRVTVSDDVPLPSMPGGYTDPVGKDGCQLHQLLKRPNSSPPERPGGLRGGGTALKRGGHGHPEAGWMRMVLRKFGSRWRVGTTVWLRFACLKYAPRPLRDSIFGDH